MCLRTKLTRPRSRRRRLFSASSVLERERGGDDQDDERHGDQADRRYRPRFRRHDVPLTIKARSTWRSAELRYGKNEQLRRIAQEIIVDQMQEIAAMKLAIGETVTNSLPARACR
jgi:hypothetical protein